MATLKEKFFAKVDPMKERVQKLGKEFGTVSVSKVDVSQVMGGARGVISMLWDTSLLDKFEGIRFHIDESGGQKSRTLASIISDS